MEADRTPQHIQRQATHTTQEPQTTHKHQEQVENPNLRGRLSESKNCFTQSATPQNSAAQSHQGCQPQQVEPQIVPVEHLHPRPQQCIGVWWTKYQIMKPTHPSLHSSILVVSMNSFWIAAGSHQLTMYPDPLFSLAAMTKHAS